MRDACTEALQAFRTLGAVRKRGWLRPGETGATRTERALVDCRGIFSVMFRLTVT